MYGLSKIHHLSYMCICGSGMQAAGEVSGALVRRWKARFHVWKVGAVGFDISVQNAMEVLPQELICM